MPAIQRLLHQHIEQPATPQPAAVHQPPHLLVALRQLVAVVQVEQQLQCEHDGVERQHGLPVLVQYGMVHAAGAEGEERVEAGGEAADVGWGEGVGGGDVDGEEEGGLRVRA